jgi:hypothetical protein
MISRKPRLYIMYGTYSERGNRPEDRLMEARPPYVPAKRLRRQGLRFGHFLTRFKQPVQRSAPRAANPNASHGRHGRRIRCGGLLVRVRFMSAALGRVYSPSFPVRRGPSVRPRSRGRRAAGELASPAAVARASY